MTDAVKPCPMFRLNAGDETRIMDASNMPVCDVKCGGMSGRTVKEGEAIAALIVGAVNSHQALVEALEAFAFVDEDHPKDTQAVWEMIYRDRVQDWFSYEDFEAARAALTSARAGL